MTTPGNDGIPQHAAPATGLWANAPFRTFVQGLGTDVGLAVALVLYTATSSDHVAWSLIPLAVAKTVLMTGASYVMKKVKPVSSSQ